MRTYSIDEVECTWAGLDFKAGLAEGSSITPARAVGTWSQVPQGAVSTVTRSRSNNRSGTVTVLVAQTSQLAQDLKAIAIRDEKPNGKEVYPMLISDTSSGELITFKNAYIMSRPEQVRATEAGVQSWVFNFEDFEDNEVTLTNVVGS